MLATELEIEQILIFSRLQSIIAQDDFSIPWASLLPYQSVELWQ